MRFWLFQTGEPLHTDAGGSRPMRVMNLANALVERGHHVVIWSSAFYHQEKRHRCRRYERRVVSDLLEVRLIPSSGYARNIGLDRLLDHAQLAFGLRRALNGEDSVPDAAFIGYPPIEFAAVAARWLKSRNVPSLLDGKDQWPEIFAQGVPQSLKWLARAALLPYSYLGRRAMRDAAGLTSMTGAFLAWMRDFSGRAPGPVDGVFPLSPGDELLPQSELGDAFQWWALRGVRNDGRFRVQFVGSFSQAMDFAPILTAAKLAERDGRSWQFVICGDGTRAAELRTLFKDVSNVVMPGWVDRRQAVALSSMAVGGLAPYRNVPDFQMSVPNKIIDYMLLGQPVLSPLRGEVQSLIEQGQIGLGYDSSVEDSLYRCLCQLADDGDLRARLARNASAVYYDRFEGRRVYRNLASLLERVAGRRHV